MPSQATRPSYHDDFISLLTGHQDILLPFIRRSIGDLATAKDILQEVNLVLWKKSAQFHKGSNFKAWAFKVAKFQILGNYRDSQRSRLIFDDDLLSQLSTKVSQVDDAWKNEHRLDGMNEMPYVTGENPAAPTTSSTGVSLNKPRCAKENGS